MRGSRRLGGGPLLLAAALLGCGPAEEPAPATPPRVVPRPPPAVAAPPRGAATSASSEPFPVPPGEPPHQRVLSQRFQLSIPLPDRPGWLLLRDKSSFLVMAHAATDSRLVARLWERPENMSRQRCERDARLIRDFPEVDQVIEERVIVVPRGFDTAVTVGLSATRPGEPIRGQVLAFGAATRWCFAFAYETRAKGPGAERLVGDRLAVIRSVTLAGIERRLAREIDPR